MIVSRISDPVCYWPDPDQTSQANRIRIRIQLLKKNRIRPGPGRLREAWHEEHEYERWFYTEWTQWNYNIYILNNEALQIRTSWAIGVVAL